MIKKLRIIHSNDIHSCFDKFISLGSIIRKYQDDSTIILDAGDFNDFSSVDTYGSSGRCGLSLLNKLNYDALVIGNNEGFLPLDNIKAMVDYNLVPLLSCNIKTINGEDIEYIKPSIMVYKNDLRILIIGASPYYDSYNVYYNLYGLKALNPYNLIKQEQEKRKGEYDICLLLSHMGFRYDSKLANENNLGVDIIIGGHSHYTIDLEKINQTYITHSGVRASHIGIIDVEICNKKISVKKSINLPFSDEDAPFDLKQLLDSQRKLAYQNLQSPITNLKDNLTLEKDRECAAANFLADCIKKYVACDFSLINSGLLNTGLNKGLITKYDIVQAFPSPINIAICYIKGSFIYHALCEATLVDKCLENGLAPGFRGYFLGKLHVSNNVIIKQDNDIIKEVLIDNKPLLMDKLYLVGTTDYNQRGSGYESLKNNIFDKYYPLHLKELVEMYISDEEILKSALINRWQ